MQDRGRLLLLLGVFCLWSLWGPPCLAQPDCAPTILLQGDAPKELSLLLNQRGIQTKPTPSCPATKVKLSRTPQGLLVEIEDPQGRKSQRTVSTIEAAAAVIQSWTSADLSDPLMFRQITPKAPEVHWSTQEEVLPRAFSFEEEVSLFVSSRALEPHEERSLSLSFLGEVGVGVDTSRMLQYGSRVGASWKQGPVRIGLFSRFARPTTQSLQYDPCNDPNSLALCQASAKALSDPASCTVDTNNDGIIDNSDCQNNTNPGDPNDPCAPNADGSIPPNCPTVPGCDPATGTNCACTTDTNGDNLITDEDCGASPPRSSAYALGFGTDISVPISLGKVFLSPAFEVSAMYAPESLVSLQTGVSLTASTKLGERLALDLRIALNRPLQDSAALFTALGFHWEGASWP